MCDVYWDDDDDASVVALQSTAHPLLQHEVEETTPRTPRGPVPPWAVFADSPPVDRTCTGVTPPRSLQPERSSPPGLPEERSAAGGQALASTLTAAFVKELFEAVRSNSTTALLALLQKAYSSGLTTSSGTVAPEHCEKIDEAVATFLSRARSPRRDGSPGSETLLGAAAGVGHVEATQLLLEARADPLVGDSHGCSALHRAAEGSNFLAVLMILDRMQAASRHVNVATLTNSEGETPEMLAALAGATEVCRVFELFSDMQDDAGLRQIGHHLHAPQDLGDGEAGLGLGSAVALVDLSTDARSNEGLVASSLLRRGVLGGPLVRDIFKRAPEDEAELRELIEEACRSMAQAEENLLTTSWDTLLCGPWDIGKPSLGAAAQRFLKTAELRSSWQRLRMAAVGAPSTSAKTLEDFWQTHLTAEAMSTAFARCQGDIFQMLLMVLWLYTREAWLFHVIDALASLLLVAYGPQGCSGAAGRGNATEGTTGATPLQPLDLPGALRPVGAMAEALAPCAQLVQTALLHFEERGVRHTSTTYRPMSLPTVALRRLLDRLNACRQDSEEDREESLFGGGVWVALGGGGFFCSMSSRMEATRRLTQTRSNVLLCIRPDDWAPCFPKHLSLRGSSVDDVLFPLGVLFRVTRATRTVSSDLDPQNDSRWPVVILEIVASSRLLEALELLDARGELGEGELEAALRAWVRGAPPRDAHRRLFAAGELLAHCGHMERAASLMGQSAFLAENQGDKVSAARTFLACARCRAVGGDVPDPANPPSEEAAKEAAAAAMKAAELFAAALGSEHLEAQAARAVAAELAASAPGAPAECQPQAVPAL